LALFRRALSVSVLDYSILMPR